LGIFESIKRSQGNIDQLTGTLRNHLQRQQEIDDQQAFYDALKKSSLQSEAIPFAEQVPTNAPSGTPLIPQQPGIGRSTVISPNAPPVYNPNYQMKMPIAPAAGVPTEAQQRQVPVDRIEALKIALAQDPSILNDNTAPLINREAKLKALFDEDKHTFQHYTPGSYVQEYDGSGRPVGQGRQYGEQRAPSLGLVQVYDPTTGETYWEKKSEAIGKQAPSTTENKAGAAEAVSDATQQNKKELKGTQTGGTPKTASSDAALKTAEVAKMTAEQNLQKKYKAINVAAVYRGDPMDFEQVLADSGIAPDDKAISEIKRDSETARKAYLKYNNLSKVKGGGTPKEDQPTGKPRISVNAYMSDPKNNTGGYSIEEIKKHLQDSGYEVSE
jgi:hypothetical protein